MKLNMSSFLQWRVNMFLYKKLSWGLVFFYINFLGKLYFLFKKDERRRVRDALGVVFAEHKDGDELDSVAKGVVNGVMRHYYEKLYNIFSSPEAIEPFVNQYMISKSLRPIDDGLLKGKGVLLVSGHLGGVELIPAFLNIRGYPVTIVAKFSSDRFRDISASKAGLFDTEIIDANNTPNIVKAIKDHLNRNRIVVTLCDEMDEWRPSHKESITFLEKHINLDRTVNILAKRCGAELVFGVMHRVNGKQYEFIANSWEQMTKAVKTSASMSVGAVLLKFLEKFIYRHPEEWYQWKKYSAMETVPEPARRTETFGFIPPLQPALA